MKTLLNLIIVIACGFSLSCETVPIQGSSPVTKTGQSLNTLAAQATQTWVDYKAGRVDYAYAVAEMLRAYQNIATTSADVKALVKAWTGDGTFAEKLASIFRASDAEPPAKMASLANGVEGAVIERF